MANQLHYQTEQQSDANVSPSFLSLPANQICLIDDCFDEAIEPVNHTTLNDAA